MEIKTKFNIGDKVIVLKESKATEIEIRSILVNETGISYTDDNGHFLMKVFPEAHCFKTKDDLIEYITSE